MTIDSVWDYHAIGRRVDRPHLERITFITPDWVRSLAQLVESENMITKLLR